jgi:phage tail-like protein
VANADPYRDYPFLLKADGATVAAFMEAPGLGSKPGADRHGPAGAIGRRPSGDGGLEPVVLRRGLGRDATFLQWARKVWHRGGDGPVPNPGDSVSDFRRDLVVERRDEAGRKVAAWTIRRCWVTHIDAPPEFDSGGAGVPIARLSISSEGVEAEAG